MQTMSSKAKSNNRKMANNSRRRKRKIKRILILTSPLKEKEGGKEKKLWRIIPLKKRKNSVLNYKYDIN